MNNMLERFVLAQSQDYKEALAQVRAGKKTGHWMWYIFPQLEGLGHSELAKHYSIKGNEEALTYLNHPLLGKRLLELSQALLKLGSNNAEEIFGPIDALKLRSCMTLFAVQLGANPVFDLVLKKFFGGQKDLITLKLLRRGSP